MNIVVGLAGGKRVGKDTTASILVEKFQNIYPVHTIAFADPIKEMLKVLLKYTGLNDGDFDALVNSNDKDVRLLPVVDSTYRTLAQTLGTEWGRDSIKGSLWVDVVRERISRLEGVIVVTDVRFENEASLIREMGGMVLHISRERDFESMDSHKSESGLVVNNDLGDMTVSNNSSIDSLRSKIDLISIVLEGAYKAKILQSFWDNVCT
jgi:hypothetical protein